MISANTSAEHTRIYKDMGGIGAPFKSAENRYAYIENMYVDHHSGDSALESIPGFRRIFDFEKRINGIFRHKLGGDAEFILVHAGECLYRFSIDEKDTLENLSPIATLRDIKSCAFCFGRRLCVMDGEKIVVVAEDGSVEEISASSPSPAYVPTTYKNLKEYEERNLLSNEFNEIFDVTSSEHVTYGSPDLIYSITDEENRYCAVTGMYERETPSPVHIPSYKKIGEKYYKVVEIAQNAFWGHKGISELITNVGLKKIGRYAFWNASNMKRVIISPTVLEINEYCFYSCSGIEEMFIGGGVVSFGLAFIGGCVSLEEIDYAGSKDMFDAIELCNTIGERSVNYYQEYNSLTVAIPVCSPAETIDSVKINGVEADCVFSSESSELILSFERHYDIEGRRVEIHGILKEGEPTGEGDFLSTDQSAHADRVSAVLGSTVCEMFDGRIFLSGNPLLGGTVFYSSKTKDGITHPFYFGSKSYFIDGAGDYPIISLVASGDELAVFKKGDDSSGTIFLHSRENNYKRAYVYSRISVRSPAVTHLDKAVFISDHGVSRLTKQESDRRGVGSLSEGINRLILAEDRDSISITSWRSYLVILAGSRIYLGDAYNGLTNNTSSYEWYILTGIGSYKNDTRVYRYASIAPKGYSIHSDIDKRASGTVMSEGSEDGSLHYYVEDGGIKFAVYPTEEMTGGSFSQASAMLGDGDLLFFGTEDGSLCLFNSDKRGTPPDCVANDPDFDAKEYKERMGRLIHPYFYSFLGHAPRYALITAEDDCGICDLEKSTSPHSLVIHLKNFVGGSIYCEIITENEKLDIGISPSSALTFPETDFSSMTLGARETSSVALNEKSSGWVRKQIALYSEEFCSPFGVYSISYRYKIKGKIKHSTM